MKKIPYVAYSLIAVIFLTLLTVLLMLWSHFSPRLQHQDLNDGKVSREIQSAPNNNSPRSIVYVNIRERHEANSRTIVDLNFSRADNEGHDLGQSIMLRQEIPDSCTTEKDTIFTVYCPENLLSVNYQNNQGQSQKIQNFPKNGWLMYADLTEEKSRRASDIYEIPVYQIGTRYDPYFQSGYVVVDLNLNTVLYEKIVTPN